MSCLASFKLPLKKLRLNLKLLELTSDFFLNGQWSMVNGLWSAVSSSHPLPQASIDSADYSSNSKFLFAQTMLSGHKIKK